MKIFNMIEIKKVEKPVEPMTFDEVDLTVLGICPDDTEPDKKAPKKKFWTKRKKRFAIGAGIAATVGAGAIAVGKALCGDDDEVLEDDPDDDEAEVEEIDDVVDEVAGNLID